MLNDERIIITRGKIFKKAFLLSIFIASIFLLCRIFIYIANDSKINILLFATEICTIITAVIILLYGAICYNNTEKDERIIANKYNYYSKTGKILLIMIFIGYAITMINHSKRAASDFSTNYIILTFELVGALFFYYQFKKNKIEINYTFINKGKKEYYIQVLKIIGSLAIILFLLYFTCGLISSFINQSLGYLLSFILAFLSSIIGIGIQYLFLSFIEKVDYDNYENKNKQAFLIISIITIIISLINAFIYTKYSLIIDSGKITEYGKYIANANYLMNNIGMLITIYHGITLIYMFSYFINQKSIKNSITMWIIIAIVNACLKPIMTSLFDIIVHHNDIYITTYVWINNIYNLIILAANVITFIYLTSSLIIEKKANKILLIILLVCFIINIGFVMFTSTQNQYVLVGSIIYRFVNIMIWLILYLNVYFKLQKEITN